MNYRDIDSDSILIKITKKDNLFFGNYCLDPYQNCEFGCSYCDSSFDQNIYIKRNAPNLLRKEIKKLKKGTIIIGYVHDAYQNIEGKYELTRSLIEIIKEYGFPCHILTKSNLVVRDIDLLSSMNSTVTISLLSCNDDISKVFESKIINPIDRLKLVKRFNEHGIKSGIALMPTIPLIAEKDLEKTIKMAKLFDSKYLLHKYLELRGDQKSIFFHKIKENFPEVFKKIESIYEESYLPNKDYVSYLDKKITNMCKKHNIFEKIT